VTNATSAAGKRQERAKHRTVLRQPRCRASQGSAAGVASFQWDGKDNTGAAVADGSYKFSATAVLGSSSSTPTTLSYGMVNNVALTSSGPTLGMGTLGDVALSSVRQVF